MSIQPATSPAAHLQAPQEPLEEEEASQAPAEPSKLDKIKQTAENGWKNFSDLGTKHRGKVTWTGRAKQATLVASASLLFILPFVITPAIQKALGVTLIALIIPSGPIGWAVLIATSLLTYLILHVLKKILLKEPKKEAEPPYKGVLESIPLDEIYARHRRIYTNQPDFGPNQESATHPSEIETENQDNLAG